MEETNTFKEEPPEWLLAEIQAGRAEWCEDWDEQDGLILVHVCRNCQSGIASCICNAPLLGTVPIWRRNQSNGKPLNARLVKYLRGKKATHDGERSFPEFTLHTPEEMKKRMALWAPAKGVPSRHPAAAYMRKLFAPGDRVLVQLIHGTKTYISKNNQARACTEEYPRALPDVTDEAFIQTLKDKNAEGWNVYVTMNPIQEESKTRKKADIACIRSVYIEVDADGAQCLEAIRTSVTAGEIPEPSVILESSVGKFQIIWFVQGFMKLEQEALNKALVDKFKTDPESVDCSRVLRLPDFYNRKPKYDPAPLVTIISESTSGRYSPADFKIETIIKSGAPLGKAVPPETVKAICEVIDAALTKAGVEFTSEEAKTDWVYQYRFVCPNPLHTTLDRYRSVAVRADGMIGSHCYHSNCDGNDWMWFRAWLEETAGEKMQFPKTAKTEPSEDMKTNTLLLFERDEDAVLAKKLGYRSATLGQPNDGGVTLRMVVFGDKTLAGQDYEGAIHVSLPIDKTAEPMMKNGRFRYPRFHKLSSLSTDEARGFLERSLNMEAVKQTTLKHVADISDYDMTPEEITAEKKKECPIFKMKGEDGAPVFNPTILYGPLKTVTEKMCEYSEADPAAIYAALLVAVGNAFGRHAYFRVDATKHFTNEYVVIIADSVGGKTGGSDQVKAFMGHVAPEWFARQVQQGGYSTIQGLITDMRDPSIVQTPIKEKGVLKGYKEVIRPGVEDKRRCIWDDEVSSLFKMAAKRETTADEVIRRGWDGQPLINKVAGKTDLGESKSIECREPMLSVIGYTTSEAAQKDLPSDAHTSGFGNRFLWVYGQCLKMVTVADERRIDWLTQKITYQGQEVPLSKYFSDLIDEAQTKGEIPLGQGAKQIFVHFYQRFYQTIGKGSGYTAKMLRRGRPHVRRIATILCLIDRENVVRPEHIQAAIAFWEYTVKSAYFIFGGYGNRVSADQIKIMKFARERQTFKIDRDLHSSFGNHKTGAWLEWQLNKLVERGFLTLEGGTYTFKKMPAGAGWTA